MEEVEEGRERGGKRAQGRKEGRWFINSGYFEKSKTTIRTAVSAVFKHARPIESRGRAAVPGFRWCKVPQRYQMGAKISAIF